MTKSLNKLVDNGKVAVLYSPGFGAGWSTWNQEVPEILFDPVIVDFVEKDQWDELATYVTLKYPGIYDSGMRDLAIAWIDVGVEFRIHEYDGNERIEIKEELAWITAWLMISNWFGICWAPDMPASVMYGGKSCRNWASVPVTKNDFMHRLINTWVPRWLGPWKIEPEQ